jgi:hypothetical protein
MVPKPFANLGPRLKSQKKTDLFTYLLILVLIRNPRWEQKRAEGYVIVSTIAQALDTISILLKVNG